MKNTFCAAGAFLVFAAALAGCWGDGNRDNPPSIPAGLTALADNATRISLSWNPSTDDFGVAGYRVFRDGVLVETV
ncbi:MAG: hydrolase, partial [Deltaproteobacteria bacterium]|nr:hydrolase [Deltaproteobacteria bacterium]